MKLAILLLLILIGLIFGFFLYRILVRSKHFARLIGGVVEPPPETPDEVINHLDGAGLHARDCADRCDVAAQTAKDASVKLQKRLNRPTPERRKKER